MSNGVKIAVVALLAVLCGGGALVGTAFLKSRRLEREAQLKQMDLKMAEQKRRTADAAAKEAAAAAQKAEAEKVRAVAAKEKEAEQRAAKLQEAENLKERQKTARLEAEASSKAKEAAVAEEKKQKALTEQAEAAKKELDARRVVEETMQKRAAEERQKAEAEAARIAAAKDIAEAALKKSENDRKTAEANAAAEHDRKLRMYRRAESSRAEMLELQRAERALALEEAGFSPDAIQQASVAEQQEPATAEGAADGQIQTNAVVSVEWQSEARPLTPAEAALSAADTAMADESRQRCCRRAKDYVATFGGLIDRATSEGRIPDANHYRRVLMTFVPNYVETYGELIGEARAAGREAEAVKLCRDLLALVPDWQRVGVMVELLAHDEAYFSRILAGLVTKDEYVKAFRRRYDQARRSNGDRDEREEAMERLCKVLATYVPDFERSPEWK